MTPEERVKKSEAEISELRKEQNRFQFQIDGTEQKLQEVKQNKDLSNEDSAWQEKNLSWTKEFFESEVNRTKERITGKEREKDAAIEERDRPKAVEAHETKETAEKIHDLNKDMAKEIDEASQDRSSHHKDTQPHSDGGNPSVPIPDLHVGPNEKVVIGSCEQNVKREVVYPGDGGVHGQVPEIPSGPFNEMMYVMGAAYVINKVKDDVVPKVADKVQGMYEQAKDAGQQAVDGLKEKYAQAVDDFNKKFAPQDAELHDLSKEKAAAEKLTEKEAFEKKPIEKKAAELNGFFEKQDNLRDAAWENVQQKTETMLQEAHKNDRLPDAYINDHNQFESNIQAARQSEQAEVQQWRSEFVEGICKKEAEKQVDGENQRNIASMKDRLKETNTGSRTDSLNELRDRLESKRDERIADRTEAFQEKHFPEIKSPSVEAPSLGAPPSGPPSGGSPAVEAPALSTPGSGSGPGAGR